MSVSSESDVTIPIQDSPEPPIIKGKKGVGEFSGIENKGYVFSPNKADDQYPDKKQHNYNHKHHTSLVLDQETSLDNTNIVNINLIPDKPSPQLGPFEPLSDYFIPINHHKKFFRRSEKLYVTKSKRKGGRNWSKALFGALGCFFLVGLVTLAILVILGVVHLPLGNDGGHDSHDHVSDELMGPSSSSMSTTLGPSTSISMTPEHSTTMSSTTNSIISTTPSTIYLTNAADLEFSLDDATYDAALANKTSPNFQQLAMQIQNSIVQVLNENIQHDDGGFVAKVQDFTPESSGNIYTKLRLGWSTTTTEAAELNFSRLQILLRNVTTLGNYSIQRLRLFEMVNLCKFSSNGCSHTCSFHLAQLKFSCSCPEPLLLSNDFKTCVQVSDEVEITTTTPTTTESEIEDLATPTVKPEQEEEIEHSSSTSTTTAEQPAEPHLTSPSSTTTHATDISSTVSSTSTTTTTTTEVPTVQDVQVETTESPKEQVNSDDAEETVTEQEKQDDQELLSVTLPTDKVPPTELLVVQEEDQMSDDKNEVESSENITTVEPEQVTQSENDE